METAQHSRANSPPTVLQPFMETADIKAVLDGASLEKQPGAELHPFMEMEFAEVESVKLETEGADRDRCSIIWLKGKNCIGSRKK
jgi:hypothetical protein